MEEEGEQFNYWTKIIRTSSRNKAKLFNQKNMKTINLLKEFKSIILAAVFLALSLPFFVSAQTLEQSYAATALELAKVYPEAKLDKQIWVSPDGNNNADGTESSPLRDINTAVQRASGGTVILVKAGTYREEVKVNNFSSNTSASRPVVLVSVDGPQKAVVEAFSDNGEALQIYDSSYIGIFGFKFVGSDKTTQSFGSVVEIDGIRGEGDHGSADGNIVFMGNHISTAGTGVDGLRVEYVNNLIVSGNVVAGTYRGQSMDLSTVWDSSITNNTFAGKAKQALVIDDGSHTVEISGNSITVDADVSVKIGGDSSDKTTNFPSEFLGYAAKNINFSDNSISNNLGDGVWLAGATDSVVSGNYFNTEGVKVQYRQVVRETSSKTQTINSSANTVDGNLYDKGIFSSSFSYNSNSQTKDNVTADNKIGLAHELGLSVGAENGATFKVDSVVQTPTIAANLVGNSVSATANLNVRQSPTLTGTILKTVSIGTKAEVMSVSKSVDGFVWYQVKFSDNTTGWVASNYVQVIATVTSVEKTVSDFKNISFSTISNIIISLDHQGRKTTVTATLKNGDILMKVFTGSNKDSIESSIASDIGVSVTLLQSVAYSHEVSPDILTKLFVKARPGNNRHWLIVVDYISTKQEVFQSGTQLEIDIVNMMFGGDWIKYGDWIDELIYDWEDNAVKDYFGNGKPMGAKDALLTLVAAAAKTTVAQAKKITFYDIKSYDDSNNYGN